jgi:guanine deaminase
MKNSKQDFMREAIGLARKSMDDGAGGPFGAVVVKDGRIIGRGQNSVVKDCDPTAHAEVLAIRNACAKLKTHVLAGCEIYASCEPCPMCLAAIYWARIDHIYYACNRDDAATAGFDDSLFYYEFTRPLEQRQTPSEQLQADEAISVLVEWNLKKDKISY